MDDIWEDISESDAFQKQKDQNWQHMRAKFILEGYREGLLAEETEQLQIGFDDGWQQASEPGKLLGKLAGIAVTLKLMHCKKVTSWRVS